MQCFYSFRRKSKDIAFCCSIIIQYRPKGRVKQGSGMPNHHVYYFGKPSLTLTPIGLTMDFEDSSDQDQYLSCSQGILRYTWSRGRTQLHVKIFLHNDKSISIYIYI